MRFWPILTFLSLTATRAAGWSQVFTAIKIGSAGAAGSANKPLGMGLGLGASIVTSIKDQGERKSSFDGTRVYDATDVPDGDRNRVLANVDSLGAGLSAALRVPLKRDLRSVMRHPVKNQGRRGTCSTFAAVALAEAYGPEVDGRPIGPRFSEQCLSKRSSGEDSGTILERIRWMHSLVEPSALTSRVKLQVWGITIYTDPNPFTLGYLKDLERVQHERGLVYEKDCPYAPWEHGRDRVPSDPAIYKMSRIYRNKFTILPLTEDNDYPYDHNAAWAPKRYPEPTSSDMFTSTQIHEIDRNLQAAAEIGYPHPAYVVRHQILLGNPVGASVYVPEIKRRAGNGKIVSIGSWSQYRKDKGINTDNIPDRSEWCSFEGGRLKSCNSHAIVFTGFDDDKAMLMFRNSWGPDWGDKGYGMMTYEYFRRFHLSGSGHPLIAATHRRPG